MSYKYMTEIVLLNKLAKAADDGKAELFETYDQLRDLTVSGPTIGGSGLGGVGGFLFKMAQLLTGSSFLPILGGPSIQIPGTSYFSPTYPGTGVSPGGQSSFGVGPWAQYSGFPVAGSAAGFDATGILTAAGMGNKEMSFSGIGDPNLPTENIAIGGAAAAIGAGSTASNMAGVGAGLVGASGFGRNFVIPAAGVVSGIGGLLTTLAPLFGGGGLAGLAAGTILSGVSGAVLSAYQSVSTRILNNADVMLTSKIKNIETVVKQIEAQEDIVKKLLKEGIDGDKKALQDL